MSAGRRSRNTLARRLGRIAVGNGADELIEVLSRLLIDQGDAIVSAVPSFGYYQTVAEMSGAEYRQVERGSDWQIPVDELVAECQRGVKMLLIGSPNNPTGDTIGTSELLRLVEAPCLVVIDEAYFEFSKETALDTALSRENVVILRSFSKWAGLAGLRIGYGIFPEWLVILLPDGASAVQRQRSGTDCGPGQPSAPGNFDGTGAIGDR